MAARLPVARLVPVPGAVTTTLGEALAAWRSAGPADPRFAADLECVGRADRPADNPRDS